RAILDNKRGYIPDHKPPVLDRLQIDSKHWLYMTHHFESRFKGLVGASHALKAACRKLKFRRTPNLGSVVELLN
ncbi:MAG: transposase, partial [Candidatus Thiodiazotropha sp. 6PLUC9]